MLAPKFFIPVCIGITLCVFPLAASGEATGTVFLTFREALGRIAADSRAVRVSRKSTEMAHEDVNRAQSPLRPQVNANAGRQYYAYQPAVRMNGLEIATFEQDFNFAGVGVSQTLYDFGANSAGLKAAQLMERAASDDARRVRNQAVLEFVNVYFDLLEIDRLVSVARDEFSSLASHLKNVAILWREGVAMKNDLLTVRVKFSFARQRLVELRNQRKVVAVRLCSLLSLDEKTKIAVEDPRVNWLEPKLSEAVAVAIGGRPELQTLDKAARAAEFREQALRASERPALFASGGYNYTENRYQSRNDNWSVNLGLKFNIFNGGLTRAEGIKERTLKEQLLEERKKAVEDIRVEVEKAFWDLQTADDKLSASRAAIRQAEENLRVNRIQYQEGSGTSTAVLDAVTLRSSVETDLWRSTYDRQRAWARLLYAMGRDISTEYMK